MHVDDYTAPTSGVGPLDRWSSQRPFRWPAPPSQKSRRSGYPRPRPPRPSVPPACRALPPKVDSCQAWTHPSHLYSVHVVVTGGCASRILKNRSTAIRRYGTAVVQRCIYCLLAVGIPSYYTTIIVVAACRWRTWKARIGVQAFMLSLPSPPLKIGARDDPGRIQASTLTSTSWLWACSARDGGSSRELVERDILKGSPRRTKPEERALVVLDKSG